MDGKTNTSGISHGSNLSIASQDRYEGACQHDDLSQDQVHQFMTSDITPVVRRTKSTVTGSNGAFSASKK